MTNRTDRQIPGWARVLGFAGLIPFIAGAVAILALRNSVASASAGFALTAYAATITAFLGGIHWGMASRTGETSSAAFIWGVVPQLMGWVSLLLPTRVGLLMSASMLAACYVVDRYSYPRADLAAWLPMRLRLTLVAVACCITGAFG